MAEENPEMKPEESPSVNSMIEATRSRAKFSGHHGALGAAGYRDPSDNNYAGSCDFLTGIGQSIAISPPSGGFDQFHIGVAWDNIHVREAGLVGKVLKKMQSAGVDLDLGCLYELQDGTRGAIQAFGEKFGHFEDSPYMVLSKDERTGNAKGEDEKIFINGRHWKDIKRLVVYIYIYQGASNWRQIRPQVVVDVPGQNDLVVSLGAYDDKLDLCAIAELENVRNGIKLTNMSEYFPGHEEMDRAFGFGLEWGEGRKSRS